MEAGQDAAAASEAPDLLHVLQTERRDKWPTYQRKRGTASLSPPHENVDHSAHAVTEERQMKQARTIYIEKGAL
jgi:hypothetical protein